MTTDVAIEVEDLHKDYGTHHAVRGISFSVRRGEVFGLLGPNGAGKTTTVEILEGYRERTAGRVAVLGMDPGPRPVALRERIGIVLQSSGLYRHLTVHEAVSHWAGLYHAPRDVEETIALSGLEAAAGRRTVTLSGGQQRRLDFALALIGDPELVFLDEPTTGLRPRGAAPGVGHGALAPAARQDRAAHDPLPRRGAGAGRPRRDHQGRRDPGRGRAGRAGRRRAALPRRMARRRAARRTSARPRTRRRCCTS